MSLRTPAFLLVALPVLAVGCGKDDSPAGPTTGDAVPTDPGVPDGSPASGTIGAAGGSLVSSDGLFSLTVPPGALSSDTEVMIQPITNTAWGGLGKGYRLTPDGLQFATPIELVFGITDGQLAVTAAGLLEGAVQDDQGRWGILQSKVLDVSGRTLTCRTSHFSDYSMVAGVQIIPWTAAVQTGQSLALDVTFCSLDTYPGPDGDELAALVITCDTELAPLGTFTNWSVNGVAGGNATFGTVNGPNSHATYTAPATVPASNPVAVSVQTTYNGLSALLVSNVTVTSGERWVGTTTGELPTGTVVVQNLTWEFVSTDGYTRVFKPSGTVVQTALVFPGCTTVSYTPSSQPIDPKDGGLTIDYTTDPPNYSGGGATYWGTYLCLLCPPSPDVQCVDGATGGGGWFGATGEVTNNGTTIAGTSVTPGGTFTFSFTKVQ